MIVFKTTSCALSGHCILRVWHHGSALRPCKCPICRRFITLLIPADAAVQECQDTGASQVLENIEKYNRNFGGGPSSIIQVNFLSHIYLLMEFFRGIARNSFSRWSIYMLPNKFCLCHIGNHFLMKCSDEYLLVLNIHLSILSRMHVLYESLLLIKNWNLRNLLGQVQQKLIPVGEEGSQYIYSMQYLFCQNHIKEKSLHYWPICLLILPYESCSYVEASEPTVLSAFRAFFIWVSIYWLLFQFLWYPSIDITESELVKKLTILVSQRLRDLPFFMRRLLRELIDPQRSLLPLVLRARIFFAVSNRLLGQSDAYSTKQIPVNVYLNKENNYDNWCSYISWLLSNLVCCIWLIFPGWINVWAIMKCQFLISRHQFLV